MDVLIRYGFSIEEIKNMMDTNPAINNIEDDDIYKLIDILGSIGCMSNIIRNIFICNPFYLSRNINDIEELIAKLKSFGLDNLNLLFDTNPYLLNLNSNDLEKMYKDKLVENWNIDEFRDYLYYNIVF